MAETSYRAEAEVLGTILLDGSLIRDCILSVKHFDDSRHRVIYNAMCEVDKRGLVVEIVAVTDQLQNGNKIEEAGGVDYLASLMGAVVSTSHFYQHQELVVGAWKVRSAKAVFHKGIAEAETTEDVSKAINTLIRIDEFGGDTRYNHKAEVTNVFNRVAEGVGVSGIPTGYTDLDAMLGNLRGGQLIVIAARPAIGKTALALNLARNATKRGAFGQIYSLEMQRTQLIQRMLSAQGAIEGSKLRDAKLNEDDWKKLTLAVGDIAELPIDIQDKSSMTVAEIRANARSLQREHKDKRHFIIIDYLQLLTGKSKGNRTEEVSEITRQLKIMAGDLNVPVIALSQLNRSVEQRADKRPVMSDLRESGSIEQDSDVVVFLYRDEKYNPQTPKKNILELIIAKQREGPTGLVELVYLENYNLIVDLARTPQ